MASGEQNQRCLAHEITTTTQARQPRGIFLLVEDERQIARFVLSSYWALLIAALAAGLAGHLSQIWVRFFEHIEAATAAVIRSVECSLMESGVGVATTITDADLRA
jgi:hypothetical protein